MKTYLFDIPTEVENVGYWQIVRKITRHCRRFDIEPKDYMDELLKDVEFETADFEFLTQGTE